MIKKLKNLKVDQKLKQAFKTILIAFIIAVILALAGIAMINANLNRFYNESYKNTQLQLEIRRDIQLVGKNVLWAITATDGTQLDKISTAETYAQRVEENIQTLSTSFSDKDKIATLQSALTTLKNERAAITSLLYSGNQAKALTLFNGTYNDATENMQNILIEIGDSANAQAATAYSRASSLVSMINVILVVVAIGSIILCIKLAKELTQLLLTPIKELQGAAQKLKAGELDIQIVYNSTDELGDLAQNFREACAEMRTVIFDMGEMLGKMADGNFNFDTNTAESYIGDFESLLSNIRRTNDALSTTLTKINQTSGQVMVGAGQLASSAQSLAEGATEQSGAVEELMATITKVSSLAEDSAEGAITAANSAKTSAENAAKSREEINKLTGAMERINETSREIENIIGAIEEIAEQTNLLALNASIEAARAGEAGRGFAVVADQIGKLAADSAQSAITTRELISKSLTEIENGNQIVDKTVVAIGSVLESMEGFANMASASADSSKTQSTMLKHVEQGIEQISSVVENNSASAEENSAISQELSAQAQTLEQMVAEFELRS